MNEKIANCANLVAAPSTTIYLKIASVHPDPRQVMDHEVPMFLASENTITFEKWDLTTQQVSKCAPLVMVCN